MANPAWQPNLLVVAPFVIIDPNGNVQLATVGGVTGLQAPTFNALTIGAITFDGTGTTAVQWVLVAILAPTTLPAFPLPALPTPTFVNDADGLDPNLIMNDMVTTWEDETGKTLYPAQVERLFINDYAYRESLVREQIQECGLLALVAFSRFPMLDYLGQLVGVSRLPSQPASTIIQFTLANALTVALTIPAGTLVGTSDGTQQFATVSPLTIAAGATTGNVQANAVMPGTAANGYGAGTINVLLAPNALIASVANTTTSAGGSLPETDDHLRARIQLAPNEFTCAGPTNSYRALALGVSPTIIDALVVSPSPGTVDVYLLTGPPVQPAANGTAAGAIASETLINEVAGILSGDTVRPLTDTVNVLAVIEVDYEITATVTLYSDAVPSVVQAAVNQAAALFMLNQSSRVQRDIVPSEIIAALSVPGVYEVTLSSPSYTQLTAGQWANCTALNLTFATSTEHS